MTRPILLFVVLAGLANGQPAFDAASVKPGGTEFVRGTSFSTKGGPGTSDPGRITYTQQRLRYILMKAWDLQFDQILGPAWVMDASGDDSYTITATMPREAISSAPDPGQGGPTLFAAIENQLGLKLVKVKSVPVDVLVIDRLDKSPTDN
jgi:hypothetical protein